jgi:hypothetical protein
VRRPHRLLNGTEQVRAHRVEVVKHPDHHSFTGLD